MCCQHLGRAQHLESGRSILLRTLIYIFHTPTWMFTSAHIDTKCECLSARVCNGFHFARADIKSQLHYFPSLHPLQDGCLLPPLHVPPPLINWKGESHFGTHITASISVNPVGALKARKLKKAGKGKRICKFEAKNCMLVSPPPHAQPGVAVLA
jgi:hypothetical protein